MKTIFPSLHHGEHLNISRFPLGYSILDPPFKEPWTSHLEISLEKSLKYAKIIETRFQRT